MRFGIGPQARQLGPLIVLFSAMPLTVDVLLVHGVAIGQRPGALAGLLRLRARLVVAIL